MTIGTLYIVSAPSGCGKTSLVNALLRSVDQICVSISHTTRPARPGEISGLNYHFVTNDQFKQLASDQAFLEYAEVFGYYYGTSLAWVQEQLIKGLDVVLEIDWQGARQIKQKLTKAIGIFILPPSWETLHHRLRQRAQDSEAIIMERMRQAKLEMSHYDEYDYLIVNTEFDKAVEDFRMIINARRLSKQVQAKKLIPLLERLT